jgi:hypothetical protein
VWDNKHWRAAFFLLQAPPSFEKKSGPFIVLNDLEFAYAPVRDKVRDLREYL